jgi:hypothetical protein
VKVAKKVVLAVVVPRAVGHSSVAQRGGVRVEKGERGVVGRTLPGVGVVQSCFEVGNPGTFVVVVVGVGRHRAVGGVVVVVVACHQDCSRRQGPTPRW